MQPRYSAKTSFYEHLSAATRKPARQLGRTQERQPLNIFAGHLALREVADAACHAADADTPLHVATAALVAQKDHYLSSLSRRYGAVREEIPIRSLVRAQSRYAAFADQHPEFWDLTATRVHLSLDAAATMLKTAKEPHDDTADLLENMFGNAEQFGLKLRQGFHLKKELPHLSKPMFTLLPERALLLGAQIVYGPDQAMGWEMNDEMHTLDEIESLAAQNQKALGFVDDVQYGADNFLEMHPYPFAVHDLNHAVLSSRIPYRRRQLAIAILGCFTSVDSPLTRSKRQFQEVRGFYLDLAMASRLSKPYTQNYRSYPDYLISSEIVIVMQADRVPAKKLQELLLAARENAQRRFAGSKERRLVLAAIDRNLAGLARGN
jgi:hypothetical protein